LDSRSWVRCKPAGDVYLSLSSRDACGFPSLLLRQHLSWFAPFMMTIAAFYNIFGDRAIEKVMVKAPFTFHFFMV
jgi:hypothetical protein